VHASLVRTGTQCPGASPRGGELLDAGGAAVLGETCKMTTPGLGGKPGCVVGRDETQIVRLRANQQQMNITVLNRPALPVKKTTDFSENVARRVNTGPDWVSKSPFCWELHQKRKS
jgi:hypothetical protein